MTDAPDEQRLAERWWWCLTHERPEHDDERDDPDSSLGPYATETAARDWQALHGQREETWKAAEDDDDDDDDDEDDAVAPEG